MKNLFFEHLIMGKTLSAAHLVDFLDGFFSKTLPLLVRSHPRVLVPVPQNKPGIIVDVVGDTFEEVVLNKGKDVFLLIYSPFCGGSMAVMPLFEQVADAVKDSPTIVIARMDKTANDFPVRGIMVTHYPTAILFPAGDFSHPDYHPLDYSDYNGSKTPHNRDVPHSHFEKETMVKFLQEHGSAFKLAS